MSEAVKQVTENTIHPSDVAKAILEAVTSDTPDFRYVVGKDGTSHSFRELALFIIPLP
jgi:hypothetical protein